MNLEANQLSKTLTKEINNQLSAFGKISASDWESKPSPQKWSKKEILGHLIDSAINNIHRFIRVQHDDQTNIFYDQDFWVRANDYQNQEIHTIIALWKLINLQIAHTWANTPDDQLSKTIPVKDELPTLQFLMEDYILHMQHHLRKINS